MSANELLVLTFVLQDSDKATFSNLITITKKYLLSLDVNFKRTSVLKKNKAADFYFLDSLNNSLKLLRCVSTLTMLLNISAIESANL